MIINTNLKEKQGQIIDYIRKMSIFARESQSLLNQQDSLKISNSESSSLSVRLIMPSSKKQRQKSSSAKYVSPYKKDGISMKKIQSNSKKFAERLGFFTNLTIRDSVKADVSPKRAQKNIITNRYLRIPSMIQKLQRNEVGTMKTEAKQMFKIKCEQKQRMNQQQRKNKWADFLLRERRWEQQKHNKLRILKQNKISQQKQYETNFINRQYPKMNFQEHIRKIKREKVKIQQKLRQLQPNYYSWRNHRSPFSRKNNSPNIGNKKQHSNSKMIHLSNQKQIQFLIKKQQL